MQLIYFLVQIYLFPIAHAVYTTTFLNSTALPPQTDLTRINPECRAGRPIIPPQIRVSDCERAFDIIRLDMPYNAEYYFYNTRRRPLRPHTRRNPYIRHYRTCQVIVNIEDERSVQSVRPFVLLQSLERVKDDCVMYREETSRGGKIHVIGTGELFTGVRPTDVVEVA